MSSPLPFPATPMPATPMSTTTMSAAPLPPDAMLGAFNAVVDRIEQAVARETDALSRRVPIDVGAAVRQKRQGLLELSRLMRAMPSTGPQGEARARLERLATLLDRNQVVVDGHLRAVREVADIVAKVMREAESDGTYTLRTGWQ